MSLGRANKNKLWSGIVPVFCLVFLPGVTRSYVEKFPEMLGQEVMTSYVRSCLDEIGGFCDLWHLGEFHCFLECAFASTGAQLVFMDI